METLVNTAAFPSVSEFRAKWCPVYLEPIHGSGERLTLGIVTKSSNGFHVHSVVRPSAMRALYGAKASGIRGLAELAVDSLKVHFAQDPPPKVWRAPVTGFFLGDWRDAASDSLDGILRQAIRSSASLADIVFENIQSAPQESDPPHESAKSRWIDVVKLEVAARRVDLLPFFDREGVIVDEGQPVRFGFIGSRLVAHFGVMRPRRLAESYKDARGRLWELRKAQQRGEFLHAGLILHFPRSDDPNFSDRDHDSIGMAREEICQEANEDNVSVHVVHNPTEAVDELVKLAA